MTTAEKRYGITYTKRPITDADETDMVADGFFPRPIPPDEVPHWKEAFSEGDDIARFGLVGLDAFYQGLTSLTTQYDKPGAMQSLQKLSLFKDKDLEVNPELMQVIKKVHASPSDQNTYDAYKLLMFGAGTMYMAKVIGEIAELNPTLANIERRTESGTTTTTLPIPNYELQSNDSNPFGLPPYVTPTQLTILITQIKLAYL